MATGAPAQPSSWGRGNTDGAVTVRCLSCRAAYPKPEGRGTVKTNPGCPECGYLGWAVALVETSSFAPRTL